MTPAAQQRINGVRVNVVAMLVAGKVTTCTPTEYRIALKAQRLGEEMERKGYLPELRRRQMLNMIAREAGAIERNATLALQDGPGSTQELEKGSDMGQAAKTQPRASEQD